MGTEEDVYKAHQAVYEQIVDGTLTTPVVEALDDARTTVEIAEQSA